MRRDVAAPTETRAGVENLSALTSLRFFAAGHVLLYHYGLMFFYNYQNVMPPDPIWLGYTSVTFFFVLSGFILTHNYASVQFDSASLRAFAFARFSRLYPVYLLSLIVSLPFLFRSIAWQADWLQPLWLASTVLSPLGLHAWIPGAACALNCPSWSVSAELFFYLLFPFLMPLALRRPRAFAGVTIVFWLLVALLYIRLWQEVGDAGSIVLAGEERSKWGRLGTQLIMHLPIGRLPEFMVGIAAYVFWSRNRERISAPVAFSAFAVLAAIILLFHRDAPEIMVHNGGTAIAWVALIVAAASVRGGALTHPLAVRLGQASYSLYLLHVPVALALFSLDTFFFARALRDWPWTMSILATVLSILLSCLVFLKFEEPSRRALRRWYAQRWPRQEIQAERPTRA